MQLLRINIPYLHFNKVILARVNIVQGKIMTIMTKNLYSTDQKVILRQLIFS